MTTLQATIQAVLDTTRAKPQITFIQGRYVYLDKEPIAAIVDKLAQAGVSCTAYGWDCARGFYLVILRDEETVTAG